METIQLHDKNLDAETWKLIRGDTTTLLHTIGLLHEIVVNDFDIVQDQEVTNLSKVIMENTFDEEKIFCHFEIELEFTQESFDNPKVNKQLDDVIKHYVVPTLVENDKESCENLNSSINLFPKLL